MNDLYEHCRFEMTQCGRKIIGNVEEYVGVGVENGNVMIILVSVIDEIVHLLSKILCD